MVSENKFSFFLLRVNILKGFRNEETKKKLCNTVDLILASMGVQNLWYQYDSRNNSGIIFLLRCPDRKRNGQLVKISEHYLKLNDKIQDFETDAMDKLTFEETIAKLNIHQDWFLSHQPPSLTSYLGDDLKIFQDKSNWHHWQIKVHDRLFDINNNVKKPHSRHIISLTDLAGNSGKSSFFKYLMFKYPEEIGRLGYGSASQLRASLVKLGKKRIYIIDLPRTKAKNDNLNDIFSVIEEAKSGVVLNVMYGSSDALLMDPPHIVLSGNFVPNFNLLSSDRWDASFVTKNKDLKPINPKVFKLKK
jgi:hypothetical protein